MSSILVWVTKKTSEQGSDVFFIQAAPLHIITARSAVHIISPFGAVYHHASACILLRLDDIQCYALVIYRNKLRMIYKAYALIYLRKRDIIRLKRVFIWQEITC